MVSMRRHPGKVGLLRNIFLKMPVLIQYDHKLAVEVRLSRPSHSLTQGSRIGIRLKCVGAYSFALMRLRAYLRVARH